MICPPTVVLVACLAVFSVSVTAVAQVPDRDGADREPDAGETDDEAREVFQLGRRAQEDGRFEDAAQYFARSYELSGLPEMLYNTGVAYERADKPAESLEWFERYLAEPGELERRSEVEERVRVLRRRASSEPDLAEPEADGGPGIAPWLVLGAGVAVAGVGSVFLVLANGAVSDVESSPRGTEWDDVAGSADDADTFSLVGALLIGVGAAAIAAGLVWAIVGGSDDETTVAFVPGGALLRGRL